MCYILMTFVGEAHADWWRMSSAQEKRHDIERTVAWFREHATAGRIAGGEELGWPGLDWEGDAVEVRPAGSAEGEAAAQEESRLPAEPA
jgi:hypothetical protein